MEEDKNKGYPENERNQIPNAHIPPPRSHNVRVHVKTKFEDEEFEVYAAGFKITQTTGRLW